MYYRSGGLFLIWVICVSSVFGADTNVNLANQRCGAGDICLPGFGEYSKDPKECDPDFGSDDGCIVFPMRDVGGKDILYNADIWVAPLNGGFEVSAKEELKYPEGVVINYVSLRIFDFFVDNGADESCFNSIADYISAFAIGFDVVSPFYSTTTTHGDLVDYQLKVNMIFKIGDLPPFAHSMNYGCPAKTEIYSKHGVIGKDLISKLKIRLELSTPEENGKFIIYRASLAQSRNFLFNTTENGEHYWRPSRMGLNMTDYQKRYNISYVNKRFWNHKQSWKKLSSFGGLSHQHKLAMVMLMKDKHIDLESGGAFPIAVGDTAADDADVYKAVQLLAKIRISAISSRDDHFESAFLSPYYESHDYLQRQKQQKKQEKEKEKREKDESTRDETSDNLETQ